MFYVVSNVGAEKQEDKDIVRVAAYIPETKKFFGWSERHNCYIEVDINTCSKPTNHHSTAEWDMLTPEEQEKAKEFLVNQMKQLKDMNVMNPPSQGENNPLNSDGDLSGDL